ncbi:MAG: hypothetical protein ABJE47_04445 [bacterium]
MKTITATDGIVWSVKIQSPGTSNAMIMFRHPDGRTSRLDRYNWVISTGPDARSVTSRPDPDVILDQLSEASILRLFQRSMPVSRPDPLTRSMDVTSA